jgi:hypothetical protein
MNIERVMDVQKDYMPLRELVQKGLSSDPDMDEPSLVEALLSQKAYLFKVEDDGKALAVFVTIPQANPSRDKLCLYLAAGSESSKWLKDMLDVVEDQAVALGSEVIEIIGRKGWEKMIKPEGYLPERIVYRKKVI